VASNDTQQGRARNRKIDIVRRSKWKKAGGAV
jgi:flagellar motor protein MotB